jgi:hypothetical protein
MADIQELRQKYPQYSDMSDEQFAKGFHDKFYSDIPFEEFSQKIGLAKPQAKVSVESAPATYGSDIPMQEPMGIPSATEGEGYGKSMQDIIKAASLRAKQTVPEMAKQFGEKVLSAPTQAAQQALPGVLPQGVVSMGMGLKDITNKLLERSVQGYESKLQQIPPLERMLGTVASDIGLPFAAQKVAPMLSKAATALEEARAFTQTGAEKKAAKIAKEALGDNLPAARKALEGVADDVTASQAMAAIDPKTGKPKLNAPTAQALLQMAQKKDPEFFANLFGKQEQERLRQLGAIAKGQDATAAKRAQDEMRRFTNERLVPTLNTELESANIAGKLKPKFEAEAERMAGAAEQKVEDVRRFTAAQDRAKEMSRQMMIEQGLPVGAAKYTYIGELGPKAEQVAQQSANASLPFGEASRFAKAASQSLEAHGLKPLESKSVVSSVISKIKDPSIAGNDNARKALTKVGRDIQQWTNEGGVIDAYALDSIRKNSVNEVAQRLFAGDPASQKKFAGQITAQINPLIVRAVEEAGGTGYGTYLRDYAAASQEIAQTKAGAKALQLYQSSPSEFVKFVEGNSPETVESIFGAGKYDLAKEMSANASMRLEKVAGEVKAGEAASEQAKMGQERLKNVLEKNVSKFRIPGLGLFSAKKNAANSILEVLQERVDKKTMMYLTDAAKDAKTFNDLINGLPIRERKKFEKVIADPETGKAIATMIGASEAKSEISKQEKQ